MFLAVCMKIIMSISLYRLRRFFKGQNLTLEEGEDIYRKRNIEKLDQAIANVEKDIFWRVWNKKFSYDLRLEFFLGFFFIH